MPPKGSKVIPSSPMTLELEGEIRELFRDGQNDKKASNILNMKYQPMGFQLSVWKYREMRESLNLFSTRKQNHTLESVQSTLAAARKQNPTSGIQELLNIVRTQSTDMRIPRRVVREWMEATEPDQVRARQGQVAKRRIFYLLGANEIWAIDQHDKWKRFELRLHVGLDVFSGKVLWLKVYWTNSNPRLICSYYLDAILENGGMPLLTHSDPGSENYGVANAQSTLRQMLDPSLEGTMQHRWLKKHSNIKPEIFWSQFRRREAPGLEQLMQEGIDNGWYNPGELDSFRDRYNTSAKRSNTKTSLPAGRPKYIYMYPDQYDGEQLKVEVPHEAVEQVRQMYAPPDHVVFQWMPQPFEAWAQKFYTHVGGEVIVRDNAWRYYHGILDLFHRLEAGTTLPHGLGETLEIQSETASPGDGWLYDPDVEENMVLLHPVGEVEYDELDEDETPVADFSDGEHGGNDGGMVVDYVF
ncbi:hypothetical protein FS749_006229 [Ceratobasidium sp. UAMH 11750]|nr:hypothetical protein FS749_006229 [Ceratobasidium sp. UAMH 11750]